MDLKRNVKNAFPWKTQWIVHLKFLIDPFRLKGFMEATAPEDTRPFIECPPECLLPLFTFLKTIWPKGDPEH